MTTTIALLRGVNLLGYNRIKMETLRAICNSIGCMHTLTLLQSGNAVFRAPAPPGPQLASSIETAIERELGFRPVVTLRTADQLRQIIARNPLPQHTGEPAKLQVMFLYKDPGQAARNKVNALPITPEEICAHGSQLYIYYPLGQGQSKLRWTPVEKALGTSGTSRNWNTVLKLHEMAQALEKM